METADSLITSLVLYGLMLAVVFLSMRGPRKNFFKQVSLKRPVLEKEVPIAIVYAVLLIVASVVIGLVASAAGGQTDADKVSQAIKTVPLPSLVIIITAAAFVEEIFFRGFLQPRTSLLFAAFVFGYFHIIYGSLVEVIGAFTLGLILGKEFQRTKSLFAPIVSHWAYNIVTLAVVFSFP